MSTRWDDHYIINTNNSFVKREDDINNTGCIPEIEFNDATIRQSNTVLSFSKPTVVDVKKMGFSVNYSLTIGNDATVKVLSSMYWRAQGDPPTIEFDDSNGLAIHTSVTKNSLGSRYFAFTDGNGITQFSNALDTGCKGSLITNISADICICNSEILKNMEGGDWIELRDDADTRSFKADQNTQYVHKDHMQVLKWRRHTIDTDHPYFGNNIPEWIQEHNDIYGTNARPPSGPLAKFSTTIKLYNSSGERYYTEALHYKFGEWGEYSRSYKWDEKGWHDIFDGQPFNLPTAQKRRTDKELLRGSVYKVGGNYYDINTQQRLINDTNLAEQILRSVDVLDLLELSEHTREKAFVFKPAEPTSYMTYGNTFHLSNRTDTNTVFESGTFSNNDNIGEKFSNRQLRILNAKGAETPGYPRYYKTCVDVEDYGNETALLFKLKWNGIGTQQPLPWNRAWDRERNIYVYGHRLSHQYPTSYLWPQTDLWYVPLNGGELNEPGKEYNYIENDIDSLQTSLYHGAHDFNALGNPIIHDERRVYFTTNEVAQLLNMFSMGFIPAYEKHVQYSYGAAYRIQVVKNSKNNQLTKATYFKFDNAHVLASHVRTRVGTITGQIDMVKLDIDESGNCRVLDYIQTPRPRSKLMPTNNASAKKLYDEHKGYSNGRHDFVMINNLFIETTPDDSAYLKTLRKTLQPVIYFNGIETKMSLDQLGVYTLEFESYDDIGNYTTHTEEINLTLPTPSTPSINVTSREYFSLGGGEDIIITGNCSHDTSAVRIVDDGNNELGSFNESGLTVWTYYNPTSFNADHSLTKYNNANLYSSQIVSSINITDKDKKYKISGYFVPYETENYSFKINKYGGDVGVRVYIDDTRFLGYADDWSLWDQTQNIKLEGTTRLLAGKKYKIEIYVKIQSSHIDDRDLRTEEVEGNAHTFHWKGGDQDAYTDDLTGRNWRPLAQTQDWSITPAIDVAGNHALTAIATNYYGVSSSVNISIVVAECQVTLSSHNFDKHLSDYSENSDQIIDALYPYAETNNNIKIDLVCDAATTNLGIEDIDVINGSLHDFTGSGTTYSVIFRPYGGGYCKISVPNYLSNVLTWTHQFKYPIFRNINTFNTRSINNPMYKSNVKFYTTDFDLENIDVKLPAVYLRTTFDNTSNVLCIYGKLRSDVELNSSTSTRKFWITTGYTNVGTKLEYVYDNYGMVEVKNFGVLSGFYEYKGEKFNGKHVYVRVDGNYSMKFSLYTLEHVFRKWDGSGNFTSDKSVPRYDFYDISGSASESVGFVEPVSHTAQQIPNLVYNAQIDGTQHDSCEIYTHVSATHSNTLPISNVTIGTYDTDDNSISPEIGTLKFKFDIDASSLNAGEELNVVLKTLTMCRIQSFAVSKLGSYDVAWPLEEDDDWELWAHDAGDHGDDGTLSSTYLSSLSKGAMLPSGLDLHFTVPINTYRSTIQNGNWKMIEQRIKAQHVIVDQNNVVYDVKNNDHALIVNDDEVDDESNIYFDDEWSAFYSKYNTIVPSLPIENNTLSYYETYDDYTHTYKHNSLQQSVGGRRYEDVNEAVDWSQNFTFKYISRNTQLNFLVNNGGRIRPGYSKHLGLVPSYSSNETKTTMEERSDMLNINSSIVITLDIMNFRIVNKTSTNDVVSLIDLSNENVSNENVYAIQTISTETIEAHDTCKWQISKDDENWTDVSTSNEYQPDINVSNRYLRAVVVHNGVQDETNSVFIRGTFNLIGSNPHEVPAIGVYVDPGAVDAHGDALVVDSSSVLMNNISGNYNVTYTDNSGHIVGSRQVSTFGDNVDALSSRGLHIGNVDYDTIEVDFPTIDTESAFINTFRGTYYRGASLYNDKPYYKKGGFNNRHVIFYDPSHSCYRAAKYLEDPYQFILFNEITKMNIDGRAKFWGYGTNEIGVSRHGWISGSQVQFLYGSTGEWLSLNNSDTNWYAIAAREITVIGKKQLTVPYPVVGDVQSFIGVDEYQISTDGDVWTSLGSASELTITSEHTNRFMRAIGRLNNDVVSTSTKLNEVDFNHTTLIVNGIKDNMSHADTAYPDGEYTYDSAAGLYTLHGGNLLFNGNMNEAFEKIRIQTGNYSTWFDGVYVRRDDMEKVNGKYVWSQEKNGSGGTQTLYVYYVTYWWGEPAYLMNYSVNVNSAWYYFRPATDTGNIARVAKTWLNNEWQNLPNFRIYGVKDTNIYKKGDVWTYTDGEIEHAIEDINANAFASVMHGEVSSSKIISQPVVVKAEIQTLRGDARLVLNASETEIYEDPGAIDYHGDELIPKSEFRMLLRRPGWYTVTTTRTNTHIRDILVNPTVQLIGDSTVDFALNQEFVDDGFRLIGEGDGIWRREPSEVSITYENAANELVDSIDTSTTGVYYVHYTHTWPSNFDLNNMNTQAEKTTRVTRTINIIQDNTKPVISRRGNAIEYVKMGTAYSDAGADVSDNTDRELSASVKMYAVDDMDSEITIDDTSPVGEYVVRYSAVDSSGNQAEYVTRSVFVENRNIINFTASATDVEAGDISVLTFSADKHVRAQPVSDEVNLEFSVFDSDGNQLRDWSGVGSFNFQTNGDVVGTSILTVRVRDGDGHSESVSVSVNTLPPAVRNLNITTSKSIVNNDSTFTIDYSAENAEEYRISYSIGNLESYQSIPSHESWTTSQTIELNVSDLNIPLHVVSFTIKVESRDSEHRVTEENVEITMDNVAPNISVSGLDGVIYHDVSETFKTPEAVASDNVDADEIVLASSVSVSSLMDNIDTRTLGTYELTYAHTDTAGNNALTMVTVVLEDRETVAYIRFPSKYLVTGDDCLIRFDVVQHTRSNNDDQNVKLVKLDYDENETVLLDWTSDIHEYDYDTSGITSETECTFRLYYNGDKYIDEKLTIYATESDMNDAGLNLIDADLNSDTTSTFYVSVIQLPDNSFEFRFQNVLTALTISRNDKFDVSAIGSDHELVFKNSEGDVITDGITQDGSIIQITDPTGIVSYACANHANMTGPVYVMDDVTTTVLTEEVKTVNAVEKLLSFKSTLKTSKLVRRKFKDRFKQSNTLSVAIMGANDVNVRKTLRKSLIESIALERTAGSGNVISGDRARPSASDVQLLFENDDDVHVVDDLNAGEEVLGLVHEEENPVIIKAKRLKKHGSTSWNAQSGKQAYVTTAEKGSQTNIVTSLVLDDQGTEVSGRQTSSENFVLYNIFVLDGVTPLIYMYDEQGNAVVGSENLEMFNEPPNHVDYALKQDLLNDGETANMHMLVKTYTSITVDKSTAWAISTSKVAVGPTAAQFNLSYDTVPANFETVQFEYSLNGTDWNLLGSVNAEADAGSFTESVLELSLNTAYTVLFRYIISGGNPVTLNATKNVDFTTLSEINGGNVASASITPDHDQVLKGNSVEFTLTGTRHVYSTGLLQFKIEQYDPDDSNNDELLRDYSSVHAPDMYGYAVSTYTFDASSLNVGTHHFRVTAQDSSNQSTAQNTVQIEIVDPTLFEVQSLTTNPRVVMDSGDDFHFVGEVPKIGNSSHHIEYKVVSGINTVVDWTSDLSLHTLTSDATDRTYKLLARDGSVEATNNTNDSNDHRKNKLDTTDFIKSDASTVISESVTIVEALYNNTTDNLFEKALSILSALDGVNANAIGSRQIKRTIQWESGLLHAASLDDENWSNAAVRNATRASFRDRLSRGRRGKGDKSQAVTRIAPTREDIKNLFSDDVNAKMVDVDFDENDVILGFTHTNDDPVTLTTKLLKKTNLTTDENWGVDSQAMVQTAKQSNKLSITCDLIVYNEEEVTGLQESTERWVLHKMHANKAIVEFTDNSGNLIASDNGNNYEVHHSYRDLNFAHASVSFTVSVNPKTVDVHNDQGSELGYYINNVPVPELTFVRGYSYSFINSSNESHPLQFYTENNGGGGEIGRYTTDVSVYSNVIKISVTSTTPSTLYYECGLHQYMGGRINVVDDADTINFPSWGLEVDHTDTDESVNLWILQKTFTSITVNTFEWSDIVASVSDVDHQSARITVNYGAISTQLADQGLGNAVFKIKSSSEESLVGVTIGTVSLDSASSEGSVSINTSAITLLEETSTYILLVNVTFGDSETSYDVDDETGNSILQFTTEPDPTTGGAAGDPYIKPMITT